MKKNMIKNITLIAFALVITVAVGFGFVYVRGGTGGFIPNLYSGAITNSRVTVNTTSTLVLATSTARQVASFCNNSLAASTNTVFMSFGEAASTTTGYALEAGECARLIDGNFPFIGPVYGLFLTASNTVGVVSDN